MTPLTARLAGILVSPRQTIASLCSSTKAPWLDAMALSTTVAFLAHSALLSTTVGRLAQVDQWERVAIAFGVSIDSALYDRLHQASTHGIAVSAMTALLTGPLVTFLASGLVLIIVRGVGQRRAPIRTVVSVVSHAGLILGLRQLVVMPINYVTETLTSPVTLSQLLSGFDESAPLARVLGAVDLFVAWWALVLAIGAAGFAQRHIRVFALAFAGLYVAVALILALVMAMAGGTA